MTKTATANWKANGVNCDALFCLANVREDWVNLWLGQKPNTGDLQPSFKILSKRMHAVRRTQIPMV